MTRDSVSTKSLNNTTNIVFVTEEEFNFDHNHFILLLIGFTEVLEFIRIFRVLMQSTVIKRCVDKFGEKLTFLSQDY